MSFKKAVLCMTERGVLVDVEAQGRFVAALEAKEIEVETKIQEFVPRELIKTKIYKTVPKGFIVGNFQSYASGKRGIYALAEGKAAINYLFNANSTKDVQQYIRFCKHPMPKHERTKEATTEQGALEKLAKKYPKFLYRLILEAREYAKQKSTYIYRPSSDGRIHPRYTNNPATGRLSAIQPNIENVPKRGPWAKLCRSQFVAAPGKRLYEFDYRAIEALLVGYLAKDEEYMRAAKLGLHGIFASHLLGDPIFLGWEDEYIERQSKKIKRTQPDIYDQAKHGGHGSNYGATPYKLHMEYPDLFPKISDAKKVQDVYFGTLAKKVRKWQQATLMEAHEKCYLQTAYGHRRYFYDIFIFRAGKQEYGQQAKDALAYVPQSLAAFVLKDVVVRLGEACPGLWLWNHDSVGFEWSDEEAQEWLPRVRIEMERPIDKLEGLSIPVEIESGPSWGEMGEFL